MNRNRRMNLTLVSLALLAILAGCGSDDSLTAPAPAAAPLLDTAPPVVPTGLAAVGDVYRVKLAWDANVVDLDLAGYLVYRLIAGEPVSLLDEPVPEARWVDLYPPANNCIYAVTAVDVNGNESAWQAVYFATGQALPNVQDIP